MCEATETATSGKADSNTQEAATHDAPRECRRSEPDERVKGLVEALQKISRMKTFPDDKTNTFTLVMAHRIADEALSTYQDKPSE